MYIGTSKVTSKGQVTIPLPIRKNRGLEAGSSVVFVDAKDSLTMRKVKEFEELFEKSRRAAEEIGLTREEVWKETERQKLITWNRLKKKLEARQRRKDASDA